MSAVNHIALEGYVYEIKNINLGTRGVAQAALLLFPDGQHRIAIYIGPEVRHALLVGEHITVEGTFCGDSISVTKVS